MRGGLSVYFIQQGDDGPIKIGIAREPAARLRGLQTGNPEQLRILRAVEGSFFVEWSLHSAFAESRIRGEWFRPTDELVDLATRVGYLEELIAGGPIVPQLRWIPESTPEAPLCDVCRVNLLAVYGADQWAGQAQCEACAETASYRESPDTEEAFA